jgi:hypothetical protein
MMALAIAFHFQKINFNIVYFHFWRYYKQISSNINYETNITVLTKNPNGTAYIPSSIFKKVSPLLSTMPLLKTAGISPAK